MYQRRWDESGLLEAGEVGQGSRLEQLRGAGRQSRRRLRFVEEPQPPEGSERPWGLGRPLWA